MDFDDTIHPRLFIDRAFQIEVEDWADLARRVVAWLAHEGYLTKAKLPIRNHASRGKFFINDKPTHSTPNFDGDWHKVGDFYVDTKYNAKSHIKNLLSALDQLGVRDPHFYLAFRKD